MTFPNPQSPAEGPRSVRVDTSTIPGWGVDADPENDPTWPMRDRDYDDAPGRHWTRPPQQPDTVEILQSVEHLQRPAVFGTAVPPSGLSGVLRRAAFRWSESRWTHWLMLMAADRINVVEGVLADIGRGKVPNIPGELGLGAAWKYDREAFLRRAAVTVGVTAGVAAIVYLIAREAD